MTEWGVVLVVIALAGLVATVVRPMISLTKSITTLTVVVDNLQREVAVLTADNGKSHDRIWKHEEKQDEQLGDHEKRIIRIEGK